MSNGSVLKVRLSLKGRPLRSYRFSQKEVSIGRDPEADIFLDNTGISRSHARFERTPGGYAVEDLGSANGTLVNDQPVQKTMLNDDDIIRVGKFSLWVGLDNDRRGGLADSAQVKPPEAFEGTVVLSNDQLDRMMTSARDSEVDGLPPEPEPERAADASSARSGVSRTVLFLTAAISFVLGATAGAWAVWLHLRTLP